MIPEAAVEAAAKYLADFAGTSSSNWEWHMDGARELLDAAAPHMLAGAWDEGAHAAWERSTPEVNGALYMWRSEGDPVNPYRPTK